MAYKEIKTQIVIKASAAKVWNILTNTKDYPRWNPFIKSIKGELKVGNILSINVDGMKFKPKVLVCDKNKELKWLGRFLVSGLFDGEHRFYIEDKKNGTVIFHHEEKFNGLLVGSYSKKLDNETKPGFIAMNKALKKLAEE